MMATSDRGSRERRGKYLKLSERMKIRIAEFAFRHGVSASVAKFEPKVGHLAYNSVKRMRDLYSEQLAYTPEGGVTSLSLGKAGRRTKLHPLLDRIVLDYIRNERRAGLVPSTEEIIAKAKRIIAETQPEVLCENGGHVAVTGGWVNSLRQRVASEEKQENEDEISEMEEDESDGDDTPQPKKRKRYRYSYISEAGQKLSKGRPLKLGQELDNRVQEALAEPQCNAGGTRIGPAHVLKTARAVLAERGQENGTGCAVVVGHKWAGSFIKRMQKNRISKNDETYSTEQDTEDAETEGEISRQKNRRSENDETQSTEQDTEDAEDVEMEGEISSKSKSCDLQGDEEEDKKDCDDVDNKHNLHEIKNEDNHNHSNEENDVNPGRNTPPRIPKSEELEESEQYSRTRDYRKLPNAQKLEIGRLASHTSINEAKDTFRDLKLSYNNVYYYKKLYEESKAFKASKSKFCKRGSKRQSSSSLSSSSLTSSQSSSCSNASLSPSCLPPFSSSLQPSSPPSSLPPCPSSSVPLNRPSLFELFR